MNGYLLNFIFDNMRELSVNKTYNNNNIKDDPENKNKKYFIVPFVKFISEKFSYMEHSPIRNIIFNCFFLVPTI
jgi:hypothetical protein